MDKVSLGKGTLAERLWRRVDIRSEEKCWEWKGFKDYNGYGQMGRGTREEGLILTHRAAYEVTYGISTKGKHILHICDNPSCCNPKHLSIGTNYDNVMDMCKKGRHYDKDRSRLTNEEKKTLRHLYFAEQCTADELASFFGINRKTIYRNLEYPVGA